MTIEPRFKLHGFVCTGPCLHDVEDLGWSTVRQIFVRRPNKCRYGIVETLRGAYEVWDFYQDGWPPLFEHEGPMPPPDAWRVYDDLDAARMAMVLGVNQ